MMEGHAGQRPTATAEGARGDVTWGDANSKALQTAAPSWA